MTAWVAVGWLGQLFFFSRFVVQWWHLERHRTSAAPVVFWYLSLSGSVLLSVYAIHREVPVLLVGFVINSLIYLRNLRYSSSQAKRLSTRAAAVIGMMVTVALILAGVASRTFTPETSTAWVACAVVGQGLWSGRFAVQWWHSERRWISHFPRAFWIFSLAGNSLLLAYAIHLRDPVFIAGLIPGPIVQIRNLIVARDTADNPATR